MILFHPKPDSFHSCPHCDVKLDVLGWYIPGMRNLANLKCSNCDKEYYGDLLAGHALNTPMLIGKDTGQVHDKYDVAWFANPLRESYSNKKNECRNFTVEQFRSIKIPLLLNCLDFLYGHSLLKLLNAQYYLDKRPDIDLIVLVPANLRWLVPSGVAAIWTVDLPFNRGAEWNDHLGAQIKGQIEQFDKCFLSVAFSHPHIEDYDIERFSRIKPFAIDEWDKRLENPSVTFIWREDRLWFHSSPESQMKKIIRRVQNRVSRHSKLDEQKKRVISLAEMLKKALPELNFSIVGIGGDGSFPEWISDHRAREIDENVEKKWCEIYSESHIVVGIHGSNMLLPSAHAGAVIELMPLSRWGNVLQDLLFSGGGYREIMFKNRIVPTSTPPHEVAVLLVSLLHSYRGMLLNMGSRYCHHEEAEFFKYPARRSSISIKNYTGFFKHFDWFWN